MSDARAKQPDEIVERYVSNDPLQQPLFEELEREEWRDHWKEMPDFEQQQLKPFCEIIVRFSDRASLEKFAALVEQTVTTRTKSIWYPKLALGSEGVCT